MKIITKIFAAATALLALVFVATPALAAGHLTDDGLGVLAVYNFTQHPNSNNFWALSTSAQPGETVEFGIYYANDGDTPIRNVRVQLSQPGANALSTHQLTGTVFSDDAGTMQGSATVTLSAPQTLTFNGTVNWDRNTIGQGAALPNGVGIFTSSGVTLGDIGPGEFGTVVVRFTVGNQQQNNVPPPQTQVNPIVTTGAASSISQNSAVVNGTIDFRGQFANATCFFDYGPTQSFGLLSTSQTVSGSSVSNFSSTLFNLNPGTTYFYRANCFVNGQTFLGNTLSFTTLSNQIVQPNIDPIVTTGPATSIGTNSEQVNGTIDFRGQFQNAVCFFEYGPSTNLGTLSSTQNVSGSNFQNFSATLFNLNSNTTYFYRANCQANGRNFTGQILSFNTQGAFVQPLQNLSVTTNPATEVFTDSARLNGFVTTNGAFQNVSVFFQYGLTTNLGNQTPVGNLGSISSSSFTSVVLGLRPNTTYFFRAVAQNQNGQIAQGQILSFTTRAAQVVVAPTPVVVQPQVVAPAISPIIISYGLDNVHPLPGDVVLYRIGWLNQSAGRLNNAILRVTLPSGLTFLDSTSGVARDGQTLIYPIGNLNAGASGFITFRAAVNQGVVIGTDLPMAIRVDFFNPTTSKNGDVTITGFTHVAPEAGNTLVVAGQLAPQTIVVATSTAPVAVNPVTTNTALFGALGDSFFPQTAVGWLLLLILAVLIVALIRRALVGSSN